MKKLFDFVQLHLKTSRSFKFKYEANVLDSDVDDDNGAMKATTVAGFIKLEELKNLFLYRAYKLTKQNPSEVDEEVIPVIECDICDLDHYNESAELESDAIPRTLSSYIETNKDLIEERPRLDTHMQMDLHHDILEQQMKQLADNMAAVDSIEYERYMDKRRTVRTIPRRVSLLKQADREASDDNQSDGGIDIKERLKDHIKKRASDITGRISKNPE